MGDGVTVDMGDLGIQILRLEANARHADRVLPLIGELLVSAVHDVYDKEGPGWRDDRDFSPNTHRKRGSMEAAKLLQDTGSMAGGTFKFAGPDWAEARGTVPYVIYHVTGTARMPARNPFDITPFEEGVLADAADLLLDEVAE